MTTNIFNSNSLRILIPSTAFLLSRLLTHITSSKITCLIYQSAYELNQIMLITKQPHLIIIQDPSFVHNNIINTLHHFILLGNKFMKKNISNLLFTTDNQKDILTFILQQIKTKITLVKLHSSINSKIKIKIEQLCHFFGIAMQQNSKINQDIHNYDVIIASNENIIVNNNQRLLVLNNLNDVQKQFIKILFEQQSAESSITILYENISPHLQKQLVTLRMKCSRPNIIKLIPFSSVQEFQLLKTQPVMGNPVIIVTCSKQLYKALDRCDLLHAQKYLLSENNLEDFITIRIQQLSEQIISFLSLSEIISTQLVLGQSSLKQVKIIDGLKLKVVQKICEQIGINYQYGKKSLKQLNNIATFQQIPSDNFTQILIFNESTYSSAQLKQFKYFINSGKIITLLVKPNNIPISQTISQFISHTCQESAVTLYLSTLIRKYSQIEPIFKHQTTLLMGKNKQQKQIIVQHSDINNNDTSIDYFLPQYSTISMQKKSIILQHNDIPIQHASGESNVYSFKQWQDLVRLSQKYKDNIKQIRVITGVWYENMLGGFRTNILKYQPLSHIKKQALNLIKFNETHFYYDEQLQQSVLEHIYHVCETKWNFIPHKIESPIQIQHSISNSLGYTLAFLTSPIYINHLRQYPQKGINFRILNATSEMHKVLFELVNSKFSSMINILFQLSELEYKRVLRSVTQTSLNSELLLSSINLSQSSIHQKDIIQKINQLRKDQVLYILVPKQLFKPLTQLLSHLKGVHLKGYNDDLIKQLKERREVNLKSLIIFDDKTKNIQKYIIQLTQNFYIGEQKHFPIKMKVSKIKFMNYFLVKNKQKLLALIELSLKKKNQEQSLNISKSSLNSQPVILFYKYPQQYSLKQQISTHCLRPIDLRAYSTAQSLVLSLKVIEAENDSFESIFIIIVLKDQDISFIQPYLQAYHKVIRLFTPNFIQFDKIPTNSNTLIQTTKYISIVNYLKGDYIQQQIERNGFIQQKTIKLALDSSHSSESAITLGRHSIHEQSMKSKQ